MRAVKMEFESVVPFPVAEALADPRAILGLVLYSPAVVFTDCIRITSGLWIVPGLRR